MSSDWAGSTYRPGHLLAIDHEARAVVLAVRDTPISKTPRNPDGTPQKPTGLRPIVQPS